MSATNQSPLDHGPTAKEWQQAHEAMITNKELWTRLQFRGVQPTGSALFELRHCPQCGSSIARPITLESALFVVAEEMGILYRTLACLSPTAGGMS